MAQIGWLTKMTYGLIAEKLGHSFSKEVHNKLFDYDYELKEIAEKDFDSFMKSKDFKAINVTIPYKERVIPYLDYLSEMAENIGAVNTIVNDNGVLKGYNTDFLGMVALINKNNIQIENKKVLILGSGGTSKTALMVAKSLKCSSVYRVSRDKKENCITYDDAKTKHYDAQVIINTTPVGMYPNIGVSAINLDDFPKTEAIIDAIYNPLRSKLVCDAKKKNLTAVGGLYMLVAQAALAAEKFIGTTVATQEIDRVYNEILSAKQNIVLVGMPGSGKTTIGKLLAKQHSMKFIDTDEQIVKRTEKSISQIFSEIGEQGFRKIETEIICSISGVQNTVISTGGGAILNKNNIDILKENGKVYFIDRPLCEIVTTSDRPLSSNKDDLIKRYEERYPLYCSCCDKQVAIENDPYINMQKISEDFYNENTCD